MVKKRSKLPVKLARTEIAERINIPEGDVALVLEEMGSYMIDRLKETGKAVFPFGSFTVEVRPDYVEKYVIKFHPRDAFRGMLRVAFKK